MGTTGMIVAIPLYTASKVIFKAFLSENKIVKSFTQNLQQEIIDIVLTTFADF